MQRQRVRKSPVASIRNRGGEAPVEISATLAKNKFGEVLDNVLRSGMVIVTRHDTPKAVLLSIDEYGALARGARSGVDTLNGEFDAMLRRMQTPKARAGMKAALNVSPMRIGKAAVRSARKRR
jgi:prevent-host-death family protein